MVVQQKVLSTTPENRETPLADGDQITVGKARITVHMGGAMLDPTVPIRQGMPGYSTPDAVSDN